MRTSVTLHPTMKACLPFRRMSLPLAVWRNRPCPLAASLIEDRKAVDAKLIANALAANLSPLPPGGGAQSHGMDIHQPRPEATVSQSHKSKVMGFGLSAFYLKILTQCAATLPGGNSLPARLSGHPRWHCRHSFLAEKELYDPCQT